MARTADQIVTERLGALHLEVVLAQARYEASEEKVAELAARVSALEAQLAGAAGAVEEEDSATPVHEETV